MEVAIIIIVVAIIVFLVLREFWTWYWKINQIIKNQQMTNHLLRILISKQYSAELEKDSDETTLENKMSRMPNLYTLPPKLQKPDVKKDKREKMVGIALMSFGGFYVLFGGLLLASYVSLMLGIMLFIAGMVTYIQGVSTERKHQKQ